MRFSCTLCGDCCRGNQLVRVNDDDMQLLAKYENVSTEDLFAKKIIEYIDDDPRPVLRFKTHPIKQCRYLINELSDNFELTGKCSLHPHFKPLVCHIAPLAREVETIDRKVLETWSIVEPSPGCPGMGQGSELPVSSPIEFKNRLDREKEFMNEKIGRVRK